MVAAPDLGRLARALGEPTRVRMLTLLMGGRALTAKELAYGAGVKPATATSHLHKLANVGLVSTTAQGRHRYFRLASASVARALESLMVVAPHGLPPPAAHAPEDPIRLARFCYDHLAGVLGTGLADALTSRGLLRLRGDVFSLTGAGQAWCRTFGIDLPRVRGARRRFAYPCLDWSERRHHLGGALGAGIAERLVSLGWITRVRNSRVVSVTVAGRRGLSRKFGLRF